MIHTTLAAALLFIAPSAWGQIVVEDAPTTAPGNHILTICDGKDKSPPCFGFPSGGGGGSQPKCEPGWELVMRFNSGGTPLCAWVLKEPTYK